MALSSVLITPAKHRPSYDPEEGDAEQDFFCVLGLGPPFCYAIPSFDVLSVELRQMRIHGATPEGDQHTYDLFIRAKIHYWLIPFHHG